MIIHSAISYEVCDMHNMIKLSYLGERKKRLARSHAVKPGLYTDKKETFERAQQKMERRRKLKGVTDENRIRYSNKYAFTGKIICGECGSRFRRIHLGHGEKYKKPLEAAPLLKFLAYSVAVIAAGAFSCAVRLVGANRHLLADAKLCAAVMDTVWRIFIAFNGAGADFAGNGGCAFSKGGGNPLEGYTLSQKLLNL
jgi:hypothetical protein